MTKFSLVDFSVRQPKLVLLLAGLLTLLFLTQFPKLRTDTNPKHMLRETSAARVWNDATDKASELYEDTFVGVQNDAGVLNMATLGRVTDAILGLNDVASRHVNGLTTITNVTADAGTRKGGLDAAARATGGA